MNSQFIKNWAARIGIMNERINIDTATKLRIAEFFLSGSQQPSYFFPEILAETPKGALAKVEPRLVNNLVDKILDRINFNLY